MVLSAPVCITVVLYNKSLITEETSITCLLKACSTRLKAEC